MKTIMYLFSVSDNFFIDYSPILKEQGFQNFVGIAYGKNENFGNFEFNDLIYISELEREILSGKYELKNDLREIEEFTNLSISNCINADRHLMKKPKQLRERLAYKIIDEAISLINKYQVDLIFSSHAADLLSFFVSEYCLKANIQFLYPIHARIGSKFFYACKFDNMPINFLERYRQNLLEEKNREEQLIKEYVANKQQPGYLASSNELQFKYLTFTQFIDYLSYIKRYFADNKSLHLTESPLELFFGKLQKIYRKIGYDKVKKYRHFSEKYFIFPLQFIPEAATLVQGSKLYDMFALIELLSKSMPYGYKLVVKEHKHCIGRRPLSFYKKISNFHNVTLCDENYDIYDLISDSSGVLTISSTMGLEAMMMGKPVGVLGQNYFNISKNAYSLHNLYEIENQLRLMIDHKFDKNDLLSIIKTILDCSFDANIHPKYYSDLDKLPNVKAYINSLKNKSA